jgi:hypothetical protein
MRWRHFDSPCPRLIRLPQKVAAAIAFALAVATLLVYLPVLHNGFVNYDDPEYIVNNPRVEAGLGWSGIAWAFQSTAAGNWHPLTWISLMADCQLFGPNPGSIHLVNVLFHTATAALLILLLNRLTVARCGGARLPLRCLHGIPCASNRSLGRRSARTY